MRVIDISVTISPALPTWPGDPRVTLERIAKIEDGANANVSRLDISVHTGTHVDAPFHFIPEGTTVEVMPLDILTGPVQVVQIPDDTAQITAEVIDRISLVKGIERVLFKTRNSAFWRMQDPVFQTDFAGITADGADELVQRGIRLVGIDYLSIAPYKQSRPTHQILLAAKMVVVEGIDLSHVEPGRYTLFCLPLKLGGADGAPARAVLITEE